MSNLEMIVMQILKKNKIKFYREKTFEDLRGGKYRFDFYCPDIHGAPAIIEVHGKQHYEQVTHFHKTLSDFKAAQERDRRKISYCLAHKIKLYCIPYWEIENIKTKNDLFQDGFLARSKWKNDEDWRNWKNKMM